MTLHTCALDSDGIHQCNFHTHVSYLSKLAAHNVWVHSGGMADSIRKIIIHHWVEEAQTFRLTHDPCVHPLA